MTRFEVPVQPPARGIKDRELKEMRTALRDVAYAVLKRCYKERLIDAPAFRQVADELEISLDPSDIDTAGNP